MDEGARQAYYRTALMALAFVEQRRPSGRRFGPEADVRWSSFQGDLVVANRIDLALRDADAQWPRAFGARTVFNIPATAEDDPFGASWPSLDPVDASKLWREVEAEVQASAAPSTPEALLTAAADSWQLSLRPTPKSNGIATTFNPFVVLASVAAGRGRFKAVRGEYGTGKTFFSRWLEHRALASGFATTLVQVSETETPLYKMETVYRRAVESMQTKEWSDGAFRSLVDRWFYNLEEEVIEGG